MIRSKTESSADVIRWIENEAAGLWPAMLGSLSFSPQSVWTRELPGLSVRRAASEPRSVRPAQRTAVRGVCSRRPCRRGAPRFDNGRALQDLLVQPGRATSRR